MKNSRIEKSPFEINWPLDVTASSNLINKSPKLLKLICFKIYFCFLIIHAQKDWNDWKFQIT